MAGTNKFHSFAQRLTATKQKWDGAVDDLNKGLDAFDAKAPEVFGLAHVAVQQMQGDLQNMHDGLADVADAVAKVIPTIAAAPAPSPALPQAQAAPLSVPPVKEPVPVPVAPAKA